MVVRPTKGGEHFSSPPSAGLDIRRLAQDSYYVENILPPASLPEPPKSFLDQDFDPPNL